MPIPLDCTDGFGEAYHGRPERSGVGRAARPAPDAAAFEGSLVLVTAD